MSQLIVNMVCCGQISVSVDAKHGLGHFTRNISFFYIRGGAYIRWSNSLEVWNVFRLPRSCCPHGSKSHLFNLSSALVSSIHNWFSQNTPTWSSLRTEASCCCSFSWCVQLQTQVSGLIYYSILLLSNASILSLVPFSWFAFTFYTEFRDFNPTSPFTCTVTW